MEMEKRVEDLETEFKLIKGEVKQSLADIRDYVLSGDQVPQVASLHDSAEEKKPQVKELDTAPPPAPAPCGDQGAYEQVEEIVDELVPAGEEERWEEAAPVKPSQLNEPFKTPEELPSHGESVDLASEKRSESSESSEASKEEDMTEKANGSILQANQLPNLIRWVSVAKREIGTAQLPTFLEAYGIRGHLSSEMKEIVLRLAAVVAEQSGEPSPADVWSRLTLELHGILSDSSIR